MLTKEYKAPRHGIFMGRRAALRHYPGQGAIEYLVLLAIVLVVAMIALMLLSYSADSSFNVRVGQSDTYWRSQAKPVAIAAHELSPDGILRLVLVNMQTDYLLIDNISVAGSGINGTYGPFYLAPSQPTVVSLDAGPSYAAGAAYELGVNISYDDVELHLPKQTQFGAQLLLGRAGEDQMRTNTTDSDRVCPQCIVCEEGVCRACHGSECD